MGQFFYVAADRLGARRRGALEAETLLDAKERLRSQGLTLLEIAPKASKGLLLSKLELLSFTLQLGELLKAGIPLYEALQTMRQEKGSPKLSSLLETLSVEIKKGSSLSLSLAKFGESFDSRYLALVAAGEAVGSLDRTFERLRELLERELKMRGELLSALTYPAVLSLFSLLLIAVLLLFVVPSMEEMFEERELKGVTALVFGASHLLREESLYLITGAATLLAALWFSRERLWPLIFSLPALGPLLARSALARFTRTLGTLLSGGLPLPEALLLSSPTLRYPALERTVERGRERVLEGRRLSQEWRQVGLFPPLLLQLVSIGEETGNLPGAFLKVADLLEGEVEKRSSKLLTLLQPFLLILLGGVIGLVMIAILLPMSEMAPFEP